MSKQIMIFVDESQQEQRQKIEALLHASSQLIQGAFLQK
jgi:hypothetical protein